MRVKGSVAAAIVLCAVACRGDVAELRRPNVVLIVTDDQGWADSGRHGPRRDLKTPHIDALADAGVRFTAGYVTAPQCSPSRAGLITGRYQQRFGFDRNDDGALPWSETTLAERLLRAGYVTGMTGKWHLQGNVATNGELPDGTRSKKAMRRFVVDNPGHVGHHGFSEYLMGTSVTYIATHDAAGRAFDAVPVRHRDTGFRIDVQTRWAASFIDRHAASGRPFFLFLSFFGPHVPLEAPDEYLRRFPGEMPERRRLALALMAAIDDGVGLVVEALRRHGVESNTLIFFLSDNGAPLSLHLEDAPGGGPGWNGSHNEPWVGEKGMLTEGGIRVPFLAAWKGVIPPGSVFDRPVISLDVAATAVAAAGLPGSGELDGVDLIPFLTGESAGEPHPSLFWRWRNQAAVRSGGWKLVTVGDGRRYLFDLGRSGQELRVPIQDRPELARRLTDQLAAWTAELSPEGIPATANKRSTKYFDFYLGREGWGQNEQKKSLR